MAVIGSRPFYIAFGAALLLSILAFQTLPQGYSMNTTINSTLAYVNKVNQSAYLLFYPNLAPAYNDINKAINVSKTNPAYAYTLLGDATSSADNQLNLINGYMDISFFVLVVIALLLTFLLYKLMKPGKKRNRA